MRIFSTNSDGSLSLFFIPKNIGKLSENNGGDHYGFLRVYDVLDSDDFCPHDARCQNDTNILETHLAPGLPGNHFIQEEVNKNHQGSLSEICEVLYLLDHKRSEFRFLAIHKQVEQFIRNDRRKEVDSESFYCIYLERYLLAMTCSLVIVSIKL